MEWSTALDRISSYFFSNWIAILALIVSVLTAYKAYWEPFELEVRDTGRIELTKHPYLIQDSAFILDLIFHNVGSRRGVVEDVALSVTSPSGERSIFRSFLEVTDRSMHYAKELETLKAESFIAFNVKGGDTIVKKVLFIPYKPEHHTFGLGNYKIDVEVRAGSTKWTRYGPIVVRVEQDDINELAKVTSRMEPGGRLFINWLTRSKVTETSENQLRSLIKK